jgi:tRNA-binding EMAP/Myf-like protein
LKTNICSIFFFFHHHHPSTQKQYSLVLLSKNIKKKNSKMPSAWTCSECEAECAATDDVCPCCDFARPKEDVSVPKGGDNDDDDSQYKNIVVAKILECEDVPGGKAKKLLVDVGNNETLTIATTATNVAVGLHVVVAKVGAIVNDTEIKTATVYGVGSQGMLCDNASLGWKGGGSNASVVPPESFPPGSKPPSSRPRMA